MKYLVIEIQKNTDGTVGNFVWSYDNIDEAESKYHSVLSIAAVSALPVHSAVILNETGYSVRSQCYTHVIPPEPEPEPEVEGESK